MLADRETDTNLKISTSLDASDLITFVMCQHKQIQTSNTYFVF